MLAGPGVGDLPPLRAARLTAALAVVAAAATAALALAGPVQAAPRLTAAKAVDRDRDGSVDAIVARFSKKVSGRATRKGPFAFAVKGYRVTAVGRARGRSVRIAVAETGACDVGLRPTVAYRPRGRQRLKAGRRTVRASRIDMARRDRRPPAITCAVTGDADGNGRIDRVTVTYSRPVRSRARRGKAVPFTVDRHVVERADRARGRELVLHLREKAAPNSGDVPAVIYRAPRRARERVRPRGRGRAARSATFNGTRDRARPLLLSATTVDGNGDGRVDAIAARFSEPVRAPSDAVAVAGAKVGASRSDGTTLVTPVSGGLGGAARPATVWGADGAVRDLAGNSAERAERQPADGVAPVIVAARTADRGGAPGHVDTVEVTFSEPVAPSGAGRPFGVTGYAVGAVAAAGGARIDVAVGEAGQPDSGARPPVGYLRGRGAAVRDGAGNEARASAFGGTADGVGPRLVAASTVDSDLDGRLDAVRYRFSEPVHGPGGVACPGCGFAAAGLTALSASVSGGAEVTVAVAAGPLNGRARPLASYGPALGGTLADAAGNAAAAGSVAAADGAAPVAVDAHTRDLDGDPKRLDAVTVTFAEPVAYPGDDKPPFAFAADGHAVAKVDPAAGNSVTVHLVPPDAPDTGSAPAIRYTGQGGAQLTDLNGTPHALRAYPGLTRDAVPPVFIEARTADRDALDGDLPGRIDAVDLIYSEDVTGSGDPAAFEVEGRAVRGVEFGPRSVQILVEEGAAPDTAATPLVTYDAAVGDVEDLPKGPGDTADPAPSAGEHAVDGAGPAIVAAVTGDATGGPGDGGPTSGPDGTIDRVAVTFSEPVTLVEGEGLPFALSGDFVATAATVDPGQPELITLAVEPGPEPDGGERPAVSVVAPGRLADGALPSNSARPDQTFAQTADGVGPAAIAARSGGRAGGACADSTSGDVDCVIVEWSEPVTEPLSAGPFAATGGLSLLGVLDRLAGGSGGEGDPRLRETHLDIAPAARNHPAVDLTYTAGGAATVGDSDGNPGVTRTVVLVPACDDRGSGEPDDVRGDDNPLILAKSLQTLCAGEEDWLRVRADVDGKLTVVVLPEVGIDTVVSLVDGSGAAVATATVTSGAAGEPDTISATGLEANGIYWLHVVGADPAHEGDYCIAPSGSSCDDGDVTPT